MKQFLLLITFLLTTCICFAENILILHTSDVHGRLVPIEYGSKLNLGGFSKRVVFFQNLRKQNQNILIFDSGDYAQGSLFYQIDKGKSSFKLMDYASYDAMTLGNHEFDDGVKYLKRNLKATKTPVVCANVEFKDKYLKNRVQPYILKEFDGKKILIIGVTTSKLRSLSNTDNVLVKNTAVSINEIINKVPADKIIVLTHCGEIEDREILTINPEIDLILGGHDHLLLNEDNKIFEDGEWGVQVGKYVFDTQKGLISSSRVLIDSSIKSDISIDMKIETCNKNISKYKSKIVGYTSETLYGTKEYIRTKQSNLGYLILDSIGKYFKDDYDCVLLQAGSIKLNKNLKGYITYADVLETLPFNDKVVKLKIQGKHLKNILAFGEKSGKSYLQKIVLPKTIEDDKYYIIITSDYLSRGKDGFKDFQYATLLKTSRPVFHKIFANYLKKR